MRAFGERLRRWRPSLTAKYVALFALLVTVPTVTTSAYLLYSSYQDNKRALIRLQQEKAKSVALTIDSYLNQSTERLSSVHGSGLSRSQLELVLGSLLGANTQEASYIDARGRQVLIVSAAGAGFSANGIPIGHVDYSGRPLFKIARSRSAYVGPVPSAQGVAEFGGSGGLLHIAAAESTGGGVVAEGLDLGAITDVINHTRLGTSGYAYAVDARGKPIAHPNGRVMTYVKTLTSLPQVKRALESSAAAGTGTGRNYSGEKVLSAYATVQPAGWRVFVEEPESQAFAPLRAKIKRTALLLVAFLALAILASMLLARRLVGPIKRMQVAARRIGAGAYGERIELDRGDELGDLADELNRMAASLEASYAGLERQVDERTRELQQTLDELAEKTRELEVASQHKSDFLANMSHELRTPLNAIVGFSQVLREGLFGDVNEKQKEYLEDILSSAHHLLSLINDILDLSKVEAGQVELEVATFSLREALERGVVMLRERAAKEGVDLGLEVDSTADLIDGDERRIRQVIFNLLSNAVKFTPEGGSVDVASARVDGEVQVSVRDTGPGIPPADRERIFDEFQQARVGSEERPEGTGLGLALSRRLVELHGGRIWVESALGSGSTFYFTIPYEAR